MSNDRLLWCDIETFGLVPETDPIIEIGFKITDLDLKTIDDFHCLIWESPAYDKHLLDMIASTDEGEEFVLKMHTDSNLFRDAQKYGISRSESSVLVIDWLRGHGFDKTDPLCGSSVHFDRNFLNYWIFDTETLLSYRNIDVSTIKELCMRFNPAIYAHLDAATQPQKKHRVLSDLDDTIAEFRFYKEEFLLEGDWEVPYLEHDIYLSLIERNRSNLNRKIITVYLPGDEPVPRRLSKKDFTALYGNSERCKCGNPVLTMAFKGAGVCSINCQKKYKGDAPQSNMLPTLMRQCITELESDFHPDEEFSKGVAFATHMMKSVLDGTIA